MTAKADEKPPVEVDEEFEVEILALGAKGDGIAKVNGFVLIVPKTKVGQKPVVRITEVRKKCAFGKVVD